MRTYLVTQGNLTERGTLATVEAAIEGGVDVVQLREKHASARERYELGRELRELTREAGVPLIVNDRVDLAAAIAADGVHLGDDDLPVSVARERLGDAVVGRSVSTVEGAERAVAAGADYLGVGAIFHTATKDTEAEETEIGLEAVRAITDAVDVPVVGIGGVTAENAASVARAGADGVAVVSAIVAAADPATATRRLREAVETAGVRA
jgi:thiamine-phosphate pyrophosphorylase